MMDVVAQLEKRAAASAQKLNWRVSIVDLLKLLDMDSSLAARKELEAIPDRAAREQRVRALTAMLHESSKSFNAAEVFELDDVVDPADTRAVIARVLTAAGPTTGSGRPVDAW